ncbi:MAG: RluA family pseudouridine synthase [Clostridiales bacterium]|nr:RluA family pseudouridine synthase [Clostridiales bacterium]
MNGETRLLIAPPRAGRVDQYLAAALPRLSRSRIQALIKAGEVTVEGTPVKSSFLLSGGEEIIIALPPAEEAQVQAREIALPILYEDRDLIVIDKPSGMVVHPAAGHKDDTLVNALLHHCRDLSGINGVLRPGIVHRLDKDTSGVLVAAKNDRAHLGLTEQWKGHNIKRVYQALLCGSLRESRGTVDAPLARSSKNRLKMAVEPERGRRAVTHYHVMRRFGAYTLVELKLETGRTHQIRVHMSYLGHPVAGDPLYGPKKCALPLSRQFLHAAVLGFKHPASGDWLEFASPLPRDLREVLEGLERDKNKD